MLPSTFAPRTYGDNRKVNREGVHPIMIRENRVANRDMARDAFAKAELAPVAESSGHMSLWI